MDYAPYTCEDLSFAGIAVGCDERCRIHNLPPTKCVAFEGTNTGRRFYMCSVPNVSNFILFLIYFSAICLNQVHLELVILCTIFANNVVSSVIDFVDHDG